MILRLDVFVVVCVCLGLVVLNAVFWMWLFGPLIDGARLGLNDAIKSWLWSLAYGTFACPAVPGH